jgi:O-antigen/teichoic acid export membrane protein
VRHKIDALYRNPTLRHSMLAYGIMVSGKGLGFILTLLLAKLMPLADYGGFIYARNMVYLLGPICTFGFTYSSLKFVSEYKMQENWGLLKGFLFFAFTTVFLLASIFIALGLAMTMMMPQIFLDDFISSTALAFLGVFFLAILLIFDPVLRSLGYTARAFAPLQLGIPLLTIAGCLLIFSLNGTISAFQSVLAFVLSVLAMAVLQMVLLIWYGPDQLKTSAKGFQKRHWAIFTLPLTFSAMAHILSDRGPLFIAGSFLRSEDIGIYGVLLALMQLSQMVIFAVFGIASPQLSGLMSQGQERSALVLLMKTRALAVVGVLGMMALLVAFAFYLMPIILAEIVIPWNIFLWVLVIPLSSALLGPVYILALAIHKNTLVLATALFSAGCVIGLSVLFIPVYGLIALPFISILGELLRIGILILVFELPLWMKVRP